MLATEMPGPMRLQSARNGYGKSAVGCGKLIAVKQHGFSGEEAITAFIKETGTMIAVDAMTRELEIAQ